MSSASRHAIAFVAALAASALVPAQNAQMHHWDGTTLGASRGGLNTVPAGFYQRYPADQTAGAISIHEFNVKLQDQNASTVENLTILIRGNTSAGPATGSPDLGPSGALGGTIFTSVSFGTAPGPSAAYHAGHLSELRASGPDRNGPRRATSTSASTSPRRREATRTSRSTASRLS